MQCQHLRRMDEKTKIEQNCKEATELASTPHEDGTK